MKKENSKFPEMKVVETTSFKIYEDSSKFSSFCTEKVLKDYRESKKPRFSIILTAILSNSILTTAKIAAFLFTGSSSMLSEAIHSLGDTCNQIFLLIGAKRSLKPLTKEHPYGYGTEQFIWSLISAFGIFFIGGVYTVYHGITTFFHPVELSNIPVALTVLFISLIMEGYTLFAAIRIYREGAKEAGMNFKDFFFKGSDMPTIAILLEDSIAVIGVGVASSCIGLTYLTGNVFFDSVGSILVGVMMGGIATFLIKRNTEVLVGIAIPKIQEDKIVSILERDPIIKSIHDVRTIIMSSNGFRFSSGIRFNGSEVSKRYIKSSGLDLVSLTKNLDSPEKLESFLIKYGDEIVNNVGTELDRLEKKVKKEMPEVEVKFIDLKAL